MDPSGKGEGQRPIRLQYLLLRVSPTQKTMRFYTPNDQENGYLDSILERSTVTGRYDLSRQALYSWDDARSTMPLREDTASDMTRTVNWVLKGHDSYRTADSLIAALTQETAAGFHAVTDLALFIHKFAETLSVKELGKPVYTKQYEMMLQYKMDHFVHFHVTEACVSFLKAGKKQLAVQLLGIFGGEEDRAEDWIAAYAAYVGQGKDPQHAVVLEEHEADYLMTDDTLDLRYNAGLQIEHLQKDVMKTGAVRHELVASITETLEGTMPLTALEKKVHALAAKTGAEAWEDLTLSLYADIIDAGRPDMAARFLKAAARGSA